LAREREGQGAKVPGSELARVLLADSLRGANWPGSEKARYPIKHVIELISGNVWESAYRIQSLDPYLEIDNTYFTCLPLSQSTWVVCLSHTHNLYISNLTLIPNLALTKDAESLSFVGLRLRGYAPDSDCWPPKYNIGLQ